MVAPVKPKKTQSFGKDSYWLVPAMVNPASPKITEINAATGINLSCTLIRDYEGFSDEVNKVTLPGALCETEDFEGIGVKKWTAADIVGYLDPQAAASADDKKVFEFLRAGFSGYLVRRQNKTADVASPDAATGEFFDVAPVSVGAASTQRTGSGEDGVYTFKSGVAITGKVHVNVAAVAS